jgi:hypothetical protein
MDVLHTYIERSISEKGVGGASPYKIDSNYFLEYYKNYQQILLGKKITSREISAGDISGEPREMVKTISAVLSVASSMIVSDGFISCLQEWLILDVLTQPSTIDNECSHL